MRDRGWREEHGRERVDLQERKADRGGEGGERERGQRAVNYEGEATCETGASERQKGDRVTEREVERGRESLDGERRREGEREKGKRGEE